MDYVHGLRSSGRPKKRWIDTIREDCDEMKVDQHTATHTAHDRRQWRPWRESVNELLSADACRRDIATAISQVSPTVSVNQKGVAYSSPAIHTIDNTGL